MSYHSLHDIDLKQVPFHNNNEQFNVQCVCIDETSFLSRWRWVECVLIILRLCHVIHYGVTAGWCIVVAIRRNWCLVIFSNKGNHYERWSLRASLVLPHHTTQSIYTYAVALFKTHSENYQTDIQLGRSPDKMDGVKCLNCKSHGDNRERMNAL